MKLTEKETDLEEVSNSSKYWFTSVFQKIDDLLAKMETRWPESTTPDYNLLPVERVAQLYEESGKKPSKVLFL